MEIIVNDKSINKQFNKERFISYCKEELLPIFKELSKHNISILKAHAAYSRKITLNKSIEEFLHIKNNPIIDEIKICLIQITRDSFWEDSVKTNLSKKYNIEDVPNCLTEAFARNESLLSFIDGGYDEDNIEIICDGEKYIIDNCCTYDQCRNLLKKLGVIIVWDDKNSFLIKTLGYKFEIRFEEGHHSIAHFHLSNQDEALSISIPDADIIKGKSRKKREIISWALANMDNIKNLWNKYHPEKKV